MKPTPIAIDRIQTESGTQMREQPNEHVVSDYAAMLDGCKDWPFDSALKVFHDGTEYYLADGFHRYLAAVRVNRSSVMCDVEKGTLRDAIRYALSANSRHGLRRTNGDKRKAVTFALSDSEWSGWSSRAIADICGVSPGFVDSLRKSEVPTVGTSAKTDTAKHDVSETRVGKNGVAQPVLKKKAKVEETAIEEDADDTVDLKPIDDASQAIINAEPGRELLSSIRSCLKELRQLPDVSGLEMILQRRSSIEAHLQNAANAVSVYLPAAVCEKCKGKKCVQCGNFGWVNSVMKKEMR